MSAVLDRLYELLADRALEGLGPAEQAELESLLREFPDIDPDGFDVAVAALDLGWHAEDSLQLPDGLQKRISGDARQFLQTGEAPVAPVLSMPAPESQPQTKASRAWLGWAVAAAAAVVALFGYLPRTDSSLSPGQARESLMAKAQIESNLPWDATPDEAARNFRSGDVVWDQESQEGFMRFDGLAVNDSEKWQYQLWIFDADRPAETPVDGGVFDITSDGELIIPIDAKLALNGPTAFAVTVEQPGGVVVSNRKRIVVTAGL